MSSSTSQASSSEKAAIPSAAASAPACAPTSAPSSPSKQADESPDQAPEFHRLVLRQVAQVHRREFSVGVLVDGQRVDHPDGVVLPQPLELVDDLAVEIGFREPEHDELNGSD